jgi:polyketide cyclase/dehydrase/lipid transport protein
MNIEIATFVEAPREIVAAVYGEYENWPRLFPTIHGVRLVSQRGTKFVLAVDHAEGEVVNEMIVRWPAEIDVRETKRHYDARFLNLFESAPGGTTFTVRGEIRLKGVARLLRPFLKGYARRLMWRLQVTPVKEEAEAQASRRVADGASRQTA